MPFCPACGGGVIEEAVICVTCGRALRPMPQPQPSFDPATRYVLPVDTSGWAIAAGYLGLFAFIVFPAPLALGAGLMAVRDLRAHPGRRGWVRTWLGLVVGGIGTALLLALVVAIALDPSE